jgi:hypothetical protein
MMIDQEIMNSGRKRVLENMKDLVKGHTIVMSGTPAGKEKRKEGKKKHGKGLEREKVKNQEIIMKETGQEVQLEGRGQGHTLDQGLGSIENHWRHGNRNFSWLMDNHWYLYLLNMTRFLKVFLP